MVNIPIGSGDFALQSSFDFETIFDNIKTESDHLVISLIKIFKYIEAMKRGESTSSLYCGKINKALKSEELVLRDLFSTDTIDDISDSPNIITVQYYSRQNIDVYLRVFYLPNDTILNHVRCLATNTMNGEILTAFIDKTLYESSEDHYTEKYAVYTILKSYMQIKLSKYNISFDLNTYCKIPDILEVATVHYFYKTLGELYRGIVTEESDGSGIIYDICMTHKTGGLSFNEIQMNEFIQDSFNGREFNYSRYKDFLYDPENLDLDLDGFPRKYKKVDC